jgi:hypothetical protein
MSLQAAITDDKTWMDGQKVGTCEDIRLAMKMKEMNVSRDIFPPNQKTSPYA